MKVFSPTPRALLNVALSIMAMSLSIGAFAQESLAREAGSLQPDSLSRLLNEPADTLPTPPQWAGESPLETYLIERTTYPMAEVSNGLYGTVVVGFIIEADGRVDGVTIEHGLSEGYEKEALRLVSSMPNWIAGHRNGEPLRSKMSLPITFSANAKMLKAEKKRKKSEGQ